MSDKCICIGARRGHEPGCPYPGSLLARQDARAFAIEPTDLSTLLAELDAKVEKMTPGPWRAFVRDIEQMSDGGKGYPLNVYPDCATVHVGHPTVDDERTGNVGLRRQEDIDGIVALVNAYPALKEGIEWLELQARGAKVHADAIDADCDRLERERDQLSDIIDTWGFAWMEEREAWQQEREREAVQLTVGGGLTVRGTMEAISRAQSLLLLDSAHPQEREDVRRSLARALASAEKERDALRTLVEQQREALRGVIAIVESKAIRGLAAFAFVHGYKPCSDEETERNIKTLDEARAVLATEVS